MPERHTEAFKTCFSLIFSPVRRHHREQQDPSHAAAIQLDPVPPALLPPVLSPDIQLCISLVLFPSLHTPSYLVLKAASGSPWLNSECGGYPQYRLRTVHHGQTHL